MILDLITLALIICIFSFLFKDNPFFKFTERLLVGVSAGYGFLIIIRDGFLAKFVDPLRTGDLSVIIPGLLGLMFVFTLFRRTAFLAKYPLAFLLGTGAGMEIGPRIETSIIKQISAMGSHVSGPVEIINRTVLFISALSSLYYFLFAVRKNTKFDRFFAGTGIVFMMIAFGATFGYTVMSRISLLIDIIDSVVLRFF